MEQATHQGAGFRRNARKKRDGLRHAKLAQNVFRLILFRRALERALPETKVSAGRQNERDGHAMVVPANRFGLHEKAVLFFQWSTALKGQSDYFAGFPALLRYEEGTGRADVADTVLARNRALPMIGG